ncbi:PREDICTED: endonuclease domain-containing 1 protein-like [Gekko japonicus]|uniref:Endonuclease domain-containing 1 protein-like n=1 Tax=Gekko japonicus TaxID=146911 RepID=A0ABM1LAN1_GEKJA|nr:PREDICTED: endonuclease domain-containing 1 protein-like [Gekko japonicus]
MLLGLLLICVGWHTTPGGAEVVTSFEETCPRFFFRETPPRIGLTPAHLVRICQRYRNQYRYATMYDRPNYIPLYSAYIYNPGKAKRPQNWMVEPQLVRSSLPPEMTLEEDLLKKQVTLAELEKSQAVLKDYKNLIDYNRGHLNPNSHQPNSDAKKSTFTLTNTVPQYEKLNGGSWANYEDKTMKVKTQGCKDTFAVVGAVPGNKYIAGKRVNQPSHVWSAACCYIDNNRIRSWAVIARNDKDAVEELTLGQLEGKLAELYQQNSISLFHSDCPRQ